MSADKQTLDFYDGAAAEYAGKFARTEPDQSLNAFMEAIPAGGMVLDFGCGPGNTAAILAEHGFEVEATDASQGMADLAKDKFGLEVRVEISPSWMQRKAFLGSRLTHF